MVSRAPLRDSRADTLRAGATRLGRALYLRAPRRISAIMVEERCQKPSPGERRLRRKTMREVRGAAFRHVTRAGLKLLLLRGKRARKPVETLVEPVARRGARRLDEPLAVPHAVKPQLLRDLRGGHSVWQVLLVGKDEKHGVAHLLFVEHLGELLPCVLDAVSVVAIDDKNKALRVLIVVAPERADLVLAADVPDGEADVLVLNGLDVEADRGDRSHHLPELQLVQDRGLTGRIETDHENPHLLLAEHALPDAREGEPHDGLAKHAAGCTTQIRKQVEIRSLVPK